MVSSAATAGALLKHLLQTFRSGHRSKLESWQTDDLRPYVDIALESFGPDRMMFGSDYPVCLLAASYNRVLDSFQEILKSLSDADRDKIFSQNAEKFYRLNDG